MEFYALKLLNDKFWETNINKYKNNDFRDLSKFQMLIINKGFIKKVIIGSLALKHQTLI